MKDQTPDRQTPS